MASDRNKYLHIAAAGTTVVQCMFLHCISVNAAATTVTVSDANGTIAIIGTATGTFTYDVGTIGSLTIVVAGTTPDITVSYL